jgi:MFS family permease
MKPRTLDIPGIRRLWLAQLISIAGDFLAIFAVLSTAGFRLHATAAQITGVTLSYMLPLAILGPLAGVFADRWSPRRTLIASDLLRAALAMLLLQASTLTSMCVILLGISTISTFFMPAQSIALRRLTPADKLLAVNTRFQQTTLILRLISPAIASALVGSFGANACYGLDVLSFVASAALLAGIPNTAPAPVPARNLRDDLATGIGFVSQNSPIARLMLALASATFALGCSSPLLAAFVRDQLHAGVEVYGMISAVLGAGLVAGTNAVPRLSKNTKSCNIVHNGLAIIAAGLALIGLAAGPLGTAMGAFAMGAGAGVLTAPAQTLIQSQTPVTLIGRVSSSVTTLIALAQILGLIVSGYVSGHVGIRAIFQAAALTALLPMIPVGFLHKTAQTPRAPREARAYPTPHKSAQSRPTGAYPNTCGTNSLRFPRISDEPSRTPIPPAPSA